MSLTLDAQIISLAAATNIKLRIYDKPGTIDRYTVVFDDGAERINFVGMNAEPFHPQGFGQHGEIHRRNVGSHLGKKLRVTDLPHDCKRLVLQDLTALTPQAEPAHA